MLLTKVLELILKNWCDMLFVLTITLLLPMVTENSTHILLHIVHQNQYDSLT